MQTSELGEGGRAQQTEHYQGGNYVLFPHLAPHMGPAHHHGRLPGFSAATASAIAAVIQPGAAVAAAETDGLPPDSLVVGFAVLLLVLTGLLNLSLGDIIADEAQLPSSTNLINKSRQRRSSFIKGGK